MTLSMRSVRGLRNDLLRAMEAGQREAAVAMIGKWELPILSRHWGMLARDDQWPPHGAWPLWLMMGGRGAGKTRAGAEWVRALALGCDIFTDAPVGRIALVGETFADVREVMIEGVSGILAVHERGERPRWEKTRKRLVWANGAIAQVFSAEDPDSLRGPQFGAAWCDEVAKWREADAAWDMLQFSLRLGTRPREFVTTTPRPIPLVKRLIASPGGALTRATTRANANNLAATFLREIVGRYAGTRLGRQELLGEIVEERPDTLFPRAMIEAARGPVPASLARIVVAVDPPVGSGKRADRCGIVAAGIDGAGTAHVIADATLARARPAEWARAAAALYHRLSADALVVEVNQGGEMAAAVIAEADPTLPVTEVRATRGKYLRAEPVAQKMEQGKVKLAGAFPALEDEMADFGLDGLSGGRSPDRLDAMVWAVSEVLFSRRQRPRVRGV